MADSNIGSLPRAPQVDDESLLVMEQQGQAMNFSGRQLKNYAVNALEMNFKDDVEAAKKAANDAKEAASSIVNMTVEAHKSDEPTVTKSMRNNRVNLDFGLPKGDKGDQGEQGLTGPIGPRGKTGNGLTILGRYDSEEALRQAVTSPEVGDVYGVGTEPPYTIYVYDGVTGDWLNYGELTGASMLDDDVVTTVGGGELTFSAGLGNAPFTVIFDDSEEPPLTAEDVEYDGGTVKDAIEQLFTSVADGKQLIASAVSDMGVPTAQDATFQQMADNIREIETGGGGDYSDATATPGDILAGKTAYTASGKVEGIIPSLQARTITPSTEAQQITAGNYIAGTQIIRGDQNLQPANIRKGVTLFDVAGAMESTFQATLTVTVDIGAVVTATHENKTTTVSALCTTGRVTMELPIEGQWTVTAQRGVAQYTSAIINVTSSYTATLTAEVHIKYFGTVTPLTTARSLIGAASIGNNAIFAGGTINDGSSLGDDTSQADAYSNELVKTSAQALKYSRRYVGGASNGSYAFFAGGDAQKNYTVFAYVDAYGPTLSKLTCDDLSSARARIAGTSVGNYVIFAGGGKFLAGTSWYNLSALVETYNQSGTHGTATNLVTAEIISACASNQNYAMFYNGGQVLAYNSGLSRTIAETSPAEATAAARAGNYVLFFNATNMYAYDLFLTRTSAEPAGNSRTYPVATTLQNYALFVGNEGTSVYADAYDAYLTRTNPGNVGAGRYGRAGASVGNYSILAGGYTELNRRPNADAYAYQYV